MRITKLFLVFIVFLACTAKKKKIPDDVKLDLRSYYEHAFAYLDKGKLDSAFAEFEQIKNLASEAHDSLNTANCLIQMAITVRDVGDYLTSQELSLEAGTYLDTSKVKHKVYLSTNYNNLGNVTGELKDYERAIEFYDMAIHYSTDTMNTKVFLNNKARALSMIGKEQEALEIYEDILHSENKDQKEYARSLTNYAFQRTKLDPDYDALSDLKEALAIRRRLDDRWGINSSYAYLALYYEGLDSDSALFYAQERNKIAIEINSVDDRLDAFKKLITLSPEKVSKDYFKAYGELSDSIQLVRSNAKNQFALIRYEVEKNKADNLKLQNEVNDKLYRINMQHLLTWSIIVVFALITVFSLFWYKRRKQRLLLEANNKIKASQLKTSRKVHDVVANGLYRVMTEIENREDIDREGILDRLESMYEKSRDISYEVEEVATANETPYHESLGEMLRSYANESRQVIMAGNEAELWAAIPQNIKNELEHTLQELMVNMRKHSGADRVVLRFDRLEGALNVFYNDNGVGLSENFSKGNGLNNTGTRMENINGSIKFVSERGEGLKVYISIPIL
ncbi:tetratricopeptide repeat-containing sensor histidine kinase [Sphingobacterium paucimobilis]|uniref:tetratricopeptide repeat-containing sensor histidine kinase n=1 Tax=Sphingobacterium paucimobilis TaxID=1385985 RepID=UPI00130EC7D4|nr:tetratricopeptide repeat-containing sensor histidine kinase [Sphingobacterium paucimobilis]